MFVEKTRLEKNKQTPVPLGKPVIIGEYALVFEPAQIVQKQSAVIEADKPVKKEKPLTTADFSVEQLNALSGIRDQIHNRLLETLDLRWVDFTAKRDQELNDLVSKRLDMILSQMSGAIPKWVDRKLLKKEMQDEVVGLGPLEDFLRDEDVSEIMVISKDQIYVEKGGRIVESKKRFSSNPALMAIIERIVAPIGKRIDESSPLVDARLKDGSRVNAIIPPLALKGPCLTIRKFGTKRMGIDDMVGFGTLSPAMAKFLEVCVKGKKNIIISGGTGSGKTTLLNVIASFIEPEDRIVTIEDAAELRLPQRHVVTLESKPANVEGKGAITIRDLVKNALRMRPDRIIVGECRSGEALDMLQAMNTGHDGSLTTVHSNSPRDTLARIETMVLMAGMDLPIRAIREQAASAFDLVVHVHRLRDGTRRVTHVTEVVGMEGDIITLQDIMLFDYGMGVDEDGKFLGRLKATGM
ncbi:MAG: CpaF family protein [Holophagae bacterium]|nr:CpaF family protein [Holophagae bacterium]